MSDSKKKKSIPVQSPADHSAPKPETTLGRKRDHTRDAKILEATIEILAESSFEGMTMDMVASRAKAGKATVYRRWSSKVELVRDALSWMNQSHLELGSLPDTGSLREDLLTLLKPQSMVEEERKFKVLAGLGSFLQHPTFADTGTAGIFDPWMVVNRELMKRAIARGEIPAHADIEMACQVITSVACFRGLVERKVFDKVFFTSLIDGIILPALKNP